MKSYKIKSIKKIGKRKVYDVSVEDNFNFFLKNTILSHNSYGRTGSGKTWKLLAIIQYYYEKGYKIWDLFGGKRKEGGFWSFPSDEKRLWFEFMKEVGEMKCSGEKEYEVDLIFPLFIQKFPNELPEMLPRIKSKIFTIFFKEIEPKHIAIVTGALSKNHKNIWNKLKKDLPDNANGEDILNWFEKEENKSSKRFSLYHSFVEPLCECKLLSGKNCKLNINLRLEARETRRIFVLMEEYTPEDFRMFFMGFLSDKIYNLVNDDLIHKKNLAFFREMNLFMKVQDESSDDADQKQILRNQISEVARYGRSGFFIAGDTQSPAEVKGLVEGQDDLLCLNELPGWRDREEVCDRLRRDGRMSAEQVAYLGSIPIHQMAVVERQKSAKLIKRVQPPRTRGWKREDGTFMNVWKKIYNSYRNIIEDLDYVKAKHLERKKIIDARRNIDNPSAKIKTNEDNVIEITEEEKETFEKVNKEKELLLETTRKEIMEEELTI